MNDLMNDFDGFYAMAICDVGDSTHDVNSVGRALWNEVLNVQLILL